MALDPSRARPATVRVHRWGPDLVIRIPRAVARDLHVAEGDVVDVRLRKRVRVSEK